MELTILHLSCISSDKGMDTTVRVTSMHHNFYVLVHNFAISPAKNKLSFKPGLLINLASRKPFGFNISPTDITSLAAALDGSTAVFNKDPYKPLA